MEGKGTSMNPADFDPLDSDENEDDERILGMEKQEILSLLSEALDDLNEILDYEKYYQRPITHAGLLTVKNQLRNILRTFGGYA